ncbi:MAG: DUF1573 domain-containing protein [Bacteroidetes bacterium]|nr:DUF1573 domain-containing protein [Bacteroidota bacterium]
MKSLLFFSIMYLMLLVGCQSDNKVEIGKKTEMKIDPLFDAGTVNKGEKIKAVFKVKNTGKSPLVISEVKGSCSCTVADFPKKPILSGESGEIKAEVNTDKTGEGKMSKSVRIVANTNPGLTVVYIKANVKIK